MSDRVSAHEERRGAPSVPTCPSTTSGVRPMTVAIANQVRVPDSVLGDFYYWTGPAHSDGVT